MRRLVFILCVFYVVMPCCANEAADLIAANDTENLMFMTDDELLDELKPIKERLAIMDADFVSYVESETPAQQVRLIRGWLAQKSFEYYDEKYMQMLRDASQSTGRSIEHEVHNLKNGQVLEYIYLDYGDLYDSDKCHNLLARRACDWPENFEAFFITKNTGGNIQTLDVSMDDVAANIHYEISINLTNESNDYETDVGVYKEYQSYDNIILNPMVEEFDYDEWYEWQNQEKADIRAGKYIEVADASESDDSNSPFGPIGIAMDESREWESNKLPGAHASGRMRNWSSVTTRSLVELNE